MTDDLDKIRAKIAKLMALATDAGASENEAETAMRHAEALMRKHAIDAATIHATGKAEAYTWVKAWVPPYKTGVATSETKWLGILAAGIGIFTDCNVGWSRHVEKGVRIEFRGETVDVAYAVWLQTHLQEVCRRESGRFAGSRRERIDFRNAMVGRIQDRMRDLKREQRDALHKHKVGTGTALVVMDQKLAKRDEIFGEQRQGKVRIRGGFASEAGREAGNKVGFGRPVEGSHVGTKRLGRDS